MIDFRSDYLEGCHPSILKLLEETNFEQTPGYGRDKYCEAAADAIRDAFGCPDAAIHFVAGGTQANAIVIDAALRTYQGVLCPFSGHINQHEAGAIEAHGHKVIALPAKDGRITSSQVSVFCALQSDDEHTVMPGMVYISLSTELGTLYDLTQLRDLYMTCRQNGIYLYIDGARLGYALASPLTDLKPEDIANCCDVFTVGGTKQGALFGEAVVITNPELNDHFRHVIKQHGGMMAKGRLLGLQYLALMKDGLYFTLAKQAVTQAMLIRDALLEKGITLFADGPTNQLFPVLSDEQAEKLEDEFIFSPWERVDEGHTAYRLCTSWATTDENTAKLISAIRAL
ncbi:MAG: aminotransferase class V-fold PLP-dependent enzyme [Clostridia bacterium]|nr:aminotransferase class V-fold PLP-dependent enzyme [Clostridia bacterium]